MTLKEIANIEADRLNRPFDGFLINRIMRLLMVEYNRLVKEKMDKEKGMNPFYRSSYKIESFTEVDSVFGTNVSGKKALRSTNKIPKPLVLNNRPQPFFYVGAADGSNSFIYTEQSALTYTADLPLIYSAVRYAYIDDYLYIFNNLLLTEALVDAPFETLVVKDADDTTGIYIDDDTEFPASSTMISTMLEIVHRKHLSDIDSKDKVPAAHVDNN